MKKLRMMYDIIWYQIIYYGINTIVLAQVVFSSFIAGFNSFMTEFPLI